MDRHLLEVHALPDDERRRRAALVEIASLASVPLEDARALVSRLPARVPRPIGPEELARRARTLEALGAVVREAACDEVTASCPTHPLLVADVICAGCGDVVCRVCAGDGETPRCARCQRRKARSRTFFYVRVSILLVVLVGVLLYAFRDVTGRRQRTSWDRTLDVAIILVEQRPVSRSATEGVSARASALAEVLEAEMRRYRREGAPPFRFRVFGPVTETEPPPSAGEPGLVSDTKYAYASWRYTSRIDDHAGVDKKHFDSRIYLVVTPPASETRKLVEGASEENGRVGIVAVELDDTMVDLALAVAAHELFHTLGATDKYDLTTGRPSVPDGLAEPDRQPRYPQTFVELMARHRPVDEVQSKPPKTLTELRVGSLTAREIGWSR